MGTCCVIGLLYVMPVMQQLPDHLVKTVIGVRVVEQIISNALLGCETCRIVVHQISGEINTYELITGSQFIHEMRTLKSKIVAEDVSTEECLHYQ